MANEFKAKNGVITPNVEVTSNVASTSKTTGALKVTGGLGVSGSINSDHSNIGGITVTKNTDINGVANQTGNVPLSIGSVTTGYQMFVDTNEIQTTNNQVASDLILNSYGGNVVVGNAASTLNVKGGTRVGSSGSVTWDEATSWSATAGAGMWVTSGTYTDSTGAAGTVATRGVSTIGSLTLASANAQTITNAASMYIHAAPTAGTNTTITNPYALYVNGGSTYLGGALTTAGWVSSQGRTVVSSTSDGGTVQYGASDSGPSLYTLGGASVAKSLAVGGYANLGFMTTKGGTVYGVQNPMFDSATVTATGGTIAAGTYYGAITTIDGNGHESAYSSATSVTTTGSTSKIAWKFFVGSTGGTRWRLYVGPSAGNYTSYFQFGPISDATQIDTSTGYITYTQTATAGTAGTPPSSDKTGAIVSWASADATGADTGAIQLKYGGMYAAGNIVSGSGLYGTFGQISNSQNAQTQFVVRNANTGAAADTRLALDNGSAYTGGVILRSTGYSGAGEPNAVALYNSTGGKLTLMTATTPGSALHRLSVYGNGEVGIHSTSASANTTSGALVVGGGVGIGGALHVGGTANVTGTLNLASNLNLSAGNIGIIGPSVNGRSGVIGTIAGTDQWFVGGIASASDSGSLEISTGDNGTEPIYVRQYSGGQPGVGVIANEIVLLDAAGNTTFPGQVYADGPIRSVSYLEGNTSILLRGRDGNVQGQLWDGNTADAFKIEAYANAANGLMLCTNGGERLKVDNTGIVTITSTATSNATTNGALVVGGGMGVAGNVMASSFQAPGTSTTWGTTNGNLTGALNAVMGAGAQATWLISATSAGTFRAGIQALDADGTMRLYANSGYVAVTTGGSLSVQGNVNSRFGQFYALDTQQVSTAGAATGVASTTGGTIPAGTYYAIVQAIDATGRSTGGGVVSTGVTTTGTTSSITWTWTAVANAISYRVFVATSAAALALGSTAQYFSVTNNQLVQTTTTGTSGTVQSINTTGSADIAGSVTAAGNVSASSSTTGTLIVTGGAGVSGDVYVGGKVVVEDGTEQIKLVRSATQYLTLEDNSTTLDPKITSYSDTTAAKMIYLNATTTAANAAQTTGTLGVSLQTLGVTRFTINTPNTGAHLAAFDSSLANVIVYGTTNSSNSASGAFQVRGGASIGSDLHVGGNVNSDLIRLSSIDDVSLTSTTHAFQIGDTASYNLVMDYNEIQSRNNGAASDLYFNQGGGNVVFGGVTETTDYVEIRNSVPATTMSNGALRIPNGGAAIVGNVIAGSLRTYGVVTYVLPAATTAAATTATTGGTVAAGTYYAKVVPLDHTGAFGVASAEMSITTTGATSTITWNWTPVTSAASYRVYVGTTSGGQSSYFAATTNSVVQTTTAGTAGTIPAATSGRATIAGATSITDATQSSSATTGALVVTGGVGVSGNLYLGSNASVRIANTTAATSMSTGALVVTGAGGISTSGAMHSNTSKIWSTQASTGGADGALIVNGGAYIGNNSVIAGTVRFTNTTAATAFNTAAVEFDGGVGVAGNVYTNGTMYTEGTLEVGYRKIPQVSKTAAYTLAATDVAKHVSITTGGVTVPNGVFGAGDVITVYNNSAAAQTITSGAGTTMYLAGTATTGNRTLAQRGLATILCVAANTFVIQGGGLT